MMITERSRGVIPSRPGDAARVGKRCVHLDQIVWLNADRIEPGDGVGSRHGCDVDGFGGPTIGDRGLIGPLSLIHTANHDAELGRPVLAQGGTRQPVSIGRDCGIGMGVCVLPMVSIGDHRIAGAGSVVARDLPAYLIAVGDPARPVRDRREGRTADPAEGAA